MKNKITPEHKMMDDEEKEFFKKKIKSEKRLKSTRNLFNEKKKNNEVTGKEIAIAIIISLIIVVLIIWGINSKNTKMEKICTEKMTQLEGFENCSYASWESITGEIYKCYCIKDNQIKEIAISKEEVKRK